MSAPKYLKAIVFKPALLSTKASYSLKIGSKGFICTKLFIILFYCIFIQYLITLLKLSQLLAKND
jgi:hypothetical protein